ncbi:MAG TPA: metallophosphatase, partial [Bacillales bacterium]|nr:metallophosphatase [Bacillales bacterium]
MQKTFRIYHTNDIHSHFNHWPQIAAYLKDGKHHCRLRGESFLQFDIGDHLDRFHPMTEGTSGRGNVQLLNEAGYDGVTIGNNEGITLSKFDLEHLYEDANFPVLVANLFDENGERPQWMQPYELFSVENGLTVAAIGITIPFTAFYKPLGWQVRNPLDLLQDLINEVRDQADIVVLLSHMGYFHDQQIARDFKGIDIILGGHTHHLLKQGVNVKGTTIIQAGKFGHYLGEMQVTYDTD